METEALVDAEIMLLGRVSFHLDHFSMAIQGPVDIQSLGAVDEDAARIVRSKLRAIEAVLTNLHGRISGGEILAGSLRYKNGAIVVSGRSLAIVVLAYGVVTSYKDLRENVILLYQDVTSAFMAVKFEEHLGSITFVPQKPDALIRDLEPFIPPKQRRLVRREPD